jgi:uridine phosphorylase
MGFTSQDLNLMRQSLGMDAGSARRIDFARSWACPKPWKRVALAGPALGAPASVFLMERLIALGARWIVGVGSCGSLQPEVTIGDVILPTWALIEEGTSAHYLGPGVATTPSPKLLEQIRGQLRAEGIVPLEGGVWTTDAPFRETIDKISSYQKRGLMAVDMEASALMTVASFRGIAFASVLVVSDEIGSLTWKRGFQDRVYLTRLSSVARCSAGVLANVG